MAVCRVSLSAQPLRHCNDASWIFDVRTQFHFDLKSKLFSASLPDMAGYSLVGTEVRYAARCRVLFVRCDISLSLERCTLVDAATTFERMTEKLCTRHHLV